MTYQATVRVWSVAAVLLVITGGSSASASSITFSGTLASPFSVPGQGAVFLPGFDPAWGTLDAVYIDGRIHIEGIATFTNNALLPLTGRVDLDLVGAVSGAGGSNVLDSPSSRIAAGLLAPGQSLSVPFGHDVTDAFFGSTAGPAAAYLASGLLPFGLSAGPFSQQWVDGAGAITANVVGQVTQGQVQVNYQFQPVPEPSTWILLSTGVLGFLIRRHRRR